MKPQDYDEKKENQVIFKCNVSDGPFCAPMEKYYLHSKSLYNSVAADLTKEIIDWDDQSI